MTSVRSVLLAAGRGVRLRPLTDVLPKPVLPVLDVPLAAPSLARLRAACPPVVVNASHLSEVVAAALGLEPGDDLMLEKPEALGTAGTLAALRERLEPPVLVHNADLLTDLEPMDLLAAHSASGAALTLAVAPVAEMADLRVRDRRAVAFFDRRTEPRATGHRYIGAAVLGGEALDLLPESVPAGLGEHVFRILVDRGAAAVFEHQGYALDVGTIGTFLRANLDALFRRFAWDPAGTVERVSAGSAYIGPGVRVEGELGPGAVLLAGAHLTSSARVSRAVVWPGELVSVELSDAVWFQGRALA